MPKVHLSLPSSFYEIDLQDYGYDDKATWADLTEDEQHEITDQIRENVVIFVDVIDDE